MNKSNTLPHSVILKVHPKTLSGKPETFTVDTAITEQTVTKDHAGNNQNRIAVLTALTVSDNLPGWKDPGQSFKRHRELFTAPLDGIVRENLRHAVNEALECWKHSEVRHSVSPEDQFQMGVHTDLKIGSTEIIIYKV